MSGALSRLVRERFGANVAPEVNRALSTIGITAGRLWPQDPERLAALVVNLSVNTIFVGPFNTVSTTRGIRINPSGGQMMLLWDEDFDLTGYEWFAVADAAASALLTVEWVTTG